MKRAEVTFCLIRPERLSQRFIKFNSEGLLMTIQPRADQLRLNDADNLNVDSAAVINDTVLKSLVDLGVLDPVVSELPPETPDSYMLWYNPTFGQHELQIGDPTQGNDVGAWVKPTLELLLLSEEDVLGVQDAIDLIVDPSDLDHSSSLNAQDVLNDLDSAITQTRNLEKHVADLTLDNTLLSITHNDGSVVSEDLTALSATGYQFDIDSFSAGTNVWETGMSFVVQNSSGLEEKQDLDLLVAHVISNAPASSASTSSQAFHAIDTAVAGDAVPGITFLGSPLVYDIATGTIYTWNDTDADGVADAYQPVEAGSSSSAGLLTNLSATSAIGAYTQSATVDVEDGNGLLFDYAFAGPQGNSAALVSVRLFFNNVEVAYHSGTAPYTSTTGTGEQQTTTNHPAVSMSVDNDLILPPPGFGSYEVRIEFNAPYGAISGALNVYVI
jgi:hypothetical protein